MVTCLQTLSKVAKVKVLIHRYSLSLIHFFLLSFLMFPILPPFPLAVKNISEYFRIFQNISEYFRIFQNISEFFKIFRKFFQDICKAFSNQPNKKRFIISIKVDMEIIKPLLV